MMTPQQEQELLIIQARSFPSLIRWACWPPLLLTLMSLAVAGAVFLREASSIKIYAVSLSGQVANVQQLTPAQVQKIKASAQSAKQQGVNSQ